jgi:transmembrane sensor
MADTDERINELFQRFVQNTCTREEMDELYAWIQDSEEGDVQLLMDERFNYITDTSKADTVDWNHMFRQIVETKRVAPVKRLWYRVAVAATVLLIVSLLGYYIINKQTGRSKDIVKTDSVSHDITAPQTTRATIVLANGEKVYLDSVVTGELAQQGNTKLEKLSNGELAYKKTTANGSKEIKYNTLNNPRGSPAVTLALSDGTKVWLNAGSSLTFPVVFTGTERKVSITGEAYFEVSKDPKKPFRVQFSSAGREGTVEVLGTHFNVNAYEDEPFAKTTLLEGKVQVYALGTQSQTLLPGQQAQLSNTGAISILKDVNLEQTMAWKNGLFNFKDTDIQTVMRQISRWYDVDVEYQGIPKDKYAGEMSRQAQLSNVFKVLETMGGVQFKIEGKKVTVIGK